MNTNAPIQDHENQFTLSKGFIFSLVFHFTLFSFTLIKLFVFPSKVELYTPTLRVDVIDLPDITKKDLDKITAGKPKPAKEEAENPAPDPKEAVAENSKSDEMVLKEKKALEKKKKEEAQKKQEQKSRSEKMNQALARVKALEKINKMSEDSEKQGAIIKGNKISLGASLTGEERADAELRYEDLILERLKANWTLPPWLARQDLSAQVLIKVDSSGRVIRLSFEKSSGHKGFDDAVQRAITESQPFPEPTKKDLIRILTNGILLGFPL